jgi:hypothetical protein
MPNGREEATAGDKKQTNSHPYTHNSKNTKHTDNRHTHQTHTQKTTPYNTHRRQKARLRLATYPGGGGAPRVVGEDGGAVVGVHLEAAVAVFRADGVVIVVRAASGLGVAIA